MNVQTQRKMIQNLEFKIQTEQLKYVSKMPLYETIR